MKSTLQIAAGLALANAWFAVAPAAHAQVPVVAPVVVDTAVPIIVQAIKPKPKATGIAKFQGFVMNANRAQITVRAKGNDLAVQTFPLSEDAASKMQTIIDKGGYQYGDKVTIYYNPATLEASKVKGKPSRPI
jgi:hypothetical protein